MEVEKHFCVVGPFSYHWAVGCVLVSESCFPLSDFGFLDTNVDLVFEQSFRQSWNFAILVRLRICSDNTNTLVGISGETGAVA